jgi:hypothetical protein
MKERVSFYFYLNWKTQIDEMTNEELRRFIDNLISWHQGGEISLPNREDKFIWNGVLPGLEANEKKYVASSGASRENGRLGGRPKKEITQESQQVILKPMEPDKSKLLNDNSKMEREKGKEVNVESELTIVNGQMSTGNQINNSGESISTFLKREIDNCNSILDSDYSNYTFLKSMANPSGIKEIDFHIEDEKELERIKSILVKLSELKYKLRGNYD